MASTAMGCVPWLPVLTGYCCWAAAAAAATHNYSCTKRTSSSYTGPHRLPILVLGGCRRPQDPITQNPITHTSTPIHMPFITGPRRLPQVHEEVWTANPGAGRRRLQDQKRGALLGLRDRRDAGCALSTALCCSVVPANAAPPFSREQQRCIRLRLVAFCIQTRRFTILCRSGVEDTIPDDLPPNEYYEYFKPDYKLHLTVSTVAYTDGYVTGYVYIYIYIQMFLPAQHA